jgi:hypothetical protein
MRSKIHDVGQAFLVGGTVLIFMFVLSAPALAQHAAKGNAPGDGAGTAGQQVAVDKNGKLRQPTPEEIQQLISGLKINESTEGLTAKRVGISSTVVDLQGRFTTVAIAKINPDGSLSKACITNAREAEDFLKADGTKQQKANSDPSKWEVK